MIVELTLAIFGTLMLIASLLNKISNSGKLVTKILLAMGTTSIIVSILCHIILSEG